MDLFREIAIWIEDRLGWPITSGRPSSQLYMSSCHGNQIRGRRGQRMTGGEILVLFRNRERIHNRSFGIWRVPGRSRRRVSGCFRVRDFAPFGIQNRKRRWSQRNFTGGNLWKFVIGGNRGNVPYRIARRGARSRKATIFFGSHTNARAVNILRGNFEILLKGRILRIDALTIPPDA